MVQILAKTLAPKDVRVNVVAPGPTDTEYLREGIAEELLQRIAALSPFDKIGELEETADAAAFLGSEESRLITGLIVRVNGGAAP